MHLMESSILRLTGIRSILRIPLMLIHIAIAKYISIPELIGNYIVVIDTIEIPKLLPRQVRSRPGIQKHRIPGTSGISRINVRLNTVQKLVIVQPQRQRSIFGYYALGNCAWCIKIQLIAGVRFFLCCYLFTR